MRTILLTIALVLLLVGCDGKKDSEPMANEETSAKNMAEVKTTTIETTPQQPSNPKFTLACSTGGGQPWYRIASNGVDIFYASVVNENNLKASKKSYEIQVSERAINIKLKSGEDNTIYYMDIDRSTLLVATKYFSSKQLYPPDGFSEMNLSCQPIDDDSLFETLKNAYDSTYAETVEKKRQYENRPNKI